MIFNKTNAKNIDELAVNTIRSYCIDAINGVKSGHPGTALSAAPIVYELYKDFLVADPKNPNWINRDRFVLSCGHASILLYTVLHLCGYDVPESALRKFRQFGEITTGHPEVGVCPGIDCSTGPLGQGVANSVGLAIAEEMLRSKYGEKVYNHYTYCLCGDGCLEEGLSQEAIQYAGLQKLSKLILLYDKNDVTLDGPLSQSSIENTKLRFEADLWNVIECVEGNNIKEIKNAIETARNFNNGRPTVVIFTTVIGHGSKNQGTCKVHGAPLGEEDGEFAKKSYGFNQPKYTLPKEVYNVFEKNFGARGKKAFENHNKQLEKIKAKNSGLYEQIIGLSTNDVSKLIEKDKMELNLESESTRNTSQRVLNHFNAVLPNLVGGSADVANSVMTNIKDGKKFTPECREGQSLNWGIREFLMCAASNGMLLHGGLRTYCGSFLMFSDYAKNAVRMSALMGLPEIFLFSHDSLAVGEDGPSHQPIEQLAGFRAMPNINLFRPCDQKETYAAWKIALESTNKPTIIVLSRQNLPLLKTTSDYSEVKKGAYVVSKSKSENPDLTIIATGSEVSLALKAKELVKNKLDIKVVSMPSQNLFDQQSEAYKKKVLGDNYEKRMSLEMMSTFGWGKYAKYNYGNDKFGASGTPADLFKAYKFTADDVAKYILKITK